MVGQWGTLAGKVTASGKETTNMSKCEGYRTGLVEINVEERPDTEAVLVEIVALGALWPSLDGKF